MLLHNTAVLVSTTASSTYMYIHWLRTLATQRDFVAITMVFMVMTKL